MNLPARCFTFIIPLMYCCSRGESNADISPSASSISHILDGSWTLVDVVIPQNGLIAPPSSSSPRYNVQATFCQIDWSLHQENPAHVSFFDDLRDQSSSCHDGGNLVTVDLYDVARQAQAYDDLYPDRIRLVKEPTGIIFHQSRCGSTLAANMLSVFDPLRTRVYSEHFAPITALRACAVDLHRPCNETLHKQLIQDVYYFLGRTTTSDNPDDNLQYLFYKSNSGGMYIDQFTTAFPETPWAFIYREPTEILQSHWKIPEVELDAVKDNHTDIPCARNYRNSVQPRFTDKVMRSHSLVPSEHSLTRTEYCAVHLEAIARSVLHEHSRTGLGSFVNYRKLPAAVWETILPHFGIKVDAAMQQRMMAVSGTYSKGGKRHQKQQQSDTVQNQSTSQEWRTDTQQKRAALTPAIRDAAERFCPDSFGEMEALAAAAAKEVERDLEEADRHCSSDETTANY